MYELVGAAMEVYNELGFGMAEPLYQEAMAMELDERSIPIFVRKNYIHIIRGFGCKRHTWQTFIVRR